MRAKHKRRRRKRRPVAWPMTKSPLAVVRAALAAAADALPAYSSRFSRKDFTQHQLFALLALREFRHRLAHLLEDPPGAAAGRGRGRPAPSAAPPGRGP